MIITAYKCDHTGKLYDDRSKYIKHLRALARSRMVSRPLHFTDTQQWWEHTRDLEMSIDELLQYIILHQNRFWSDSRSRNGLDWAPLGKNISGMIVPVPKLLAFTECSLVWSDNVSNTHDCPHNGVTNWRCEPDKPRGYPGWTGSLRWVISWPRKLSGVHLGSGLFSGPNSRIHTGTGGGGSAQFTTIAKYGQDIKEYGYSIRMYADDWPGLARGESKRQFAAVLRGERNSTTVWCP